MAGSVGSAPLLISEAPGFSLNEDGRTSMPKAKSESAVPFPRLEHRTTAKEDVELSTPWNNIAALWLLGLMNNMLYVVMNAGANNISSSAIALTYIAGTFPGLVVVLTGWFHYLSYQTRVVICSGLMTASLLTVAWGDSTGVKLLGVAFASAQGGLGEPTIMAITSFYSKPRTLITAWASGTGMAGILGYGWNVLFEKGFGVSFRVTLMVALWIPVAFFLCFKYLLSPPREKFTPEESRLLPSSKGASEASSSTADMNQVQSTAETASLGFYERLLFVMHLWPYLIPLILVYVSEYVIQSGAWSAFGFPVTDKDSRENFYVYANWSYQVGVFISRSSGTIFQADRIVLWIMPIIQCGLMAFFIAGSWFQFAESWGYGGILPIAVFVGLLGGAVYVNAYTLLGAEIDERYKELGLSSMAIGENVGIMIAEIISIFLQGCLLGHAGASNADKPAFTCGFDDVWANSTS